MKQPWKILHLINDFKDYFLAYGEPVYENPSPGNKAGGITTLEDKSLGCTQKSGTSAVVDVLKYGRNSKPGLSCWKVLENLVAASALALPIANSSYLPLVARHLRLCADHESCHESRDLPEETPLDGFQRWSLVGRADGGRAGRLYSSDHRYCQWKTDAYEANNVREIAIFKNGVTL